MRYEDLGTVSQCADEMVWILDHIVIVRLRFAGDGPFSGDGRYDLELFARFDWFRDFLEIGRAHV